MKRRIRGSTPEVEAAAREMRKKPTPAEAALWEALRGKQVRGLRFREQHPIGRFVFDFYCAACKLVIEVDGEYHDDPDQQDRDKARTEYLNAGGYAVLRFRNEEILSDLPSVIARIEAALPR
jgi:very-short-patch-repair endonuclease